MRIAIFSDVFFPELSGLSDSIVSLGAELARRGHTIRFYAPRYSAANYKKVNLIPRELDLSKNVSVSRFFSVPYPTGTNQGRAVIPTGLRWLGVQNFRPDIIHTQLFWGAGLEAIATSKMLKVPLIGTNHTAVKEYLRYSPIKAEWLGQAMLKYVNWYYSQCQLTTAPSSSVIEEMRHFGFEKESHIISNPIDVEMFQPLANKNWLKEKFHFGEHAVIHAGRLSAERSPEVLVRAIAIVKKKIPDAELVFAGQGATEHELRKLARELGIENNVRFMGVLSKPDLNEAYNATKMFVIASTSDTQSMVMMQAMASGLPVIGVKARALPEYIKKDNGFLVEPADAEGFAEKIIHLFEHPDERKTLGSGGRKHALQFGVPHIAGLWEAIYGKIIQIHRAQNIRLSR